MMISNANATVPRVAPARWLMRLIKLSSGQLSRRVNWSTDV